MNPLLIKRLHRPSIPEKQMKSTQNRIPRAKKLADVANSVNSRNSNHKMSHKFFHCKITFVSVKFSVACVFEVFSVTTMTAIELFRAHDARKLQLNLLSFLTGSWEILWPIKFFISIFMVFPSKLWGKKVAWTNCFGVIVLFRLSFALVLSHKRFFYCFFSSGNYHFHFIVEINKHI